MSESASKNLKQLQDLAIQWNVAIYTKENKNSKAIEKPYPQIQLPYFL